MTHLLVKLKLLLNIYVIALYACLFRVSLAAYGTQNWTRLWSDVEMEPLKFISTLRKATSEYSAASVAASLSLGSITSRCSRMEPALLPRTHGEERRADSSERWKSSLVFFQATCITYNHGWKLSTYALCFSVFLIFFFSLIFFNIVGFSFLCEGELNSVLEKLKERWHQRRCPWRIKSLHVSLSWIKSFLFLDDEL